MQRHSVRDIPLRKCVASIIAKREFELKKNAAAVRYLS